MASSSSRTFFSSCSTRRSRSESFLLGVSISFLREVVVKQTAIPFWPLPHGLQSVSAMLTKLSSHAHNVPAFAKAAKVGIGTPHRPLGARRLSYPRSSGLFVRALRITSFMGEACGHLRGGRVLVCGSSNPQRLARPIGTGNEAPYFITRSRAMKSTLNGSMTESFQKAL